MSRIWERLKREMRQTYVTTGCSTRESRTFQTFKYLLMILEQAQNVGIHTNKLPA